MTLAATYFGANGWLLEFDCLNVLIDPWLKGSLSFPPGRWFLHGELPEERSIPEQIDLLLLTQGLADHAHPATLDALPRDLPIVGSPAAAAVVKRLGFQTITSLAPGQQYEIADLTIQATAGAPVPMVENGYVLRHPAGRLYLEPHGFLDPSLAAEPLDAVITPMVDLGLLGLGNFVKGNQVVPELVSRFQPSTVLASTSGGDIEFGGALSGLIQQVGTVADTGAALSDQIQWLDPTPGVRNVLHTKR